MDTYASNGNFCQNCDVIKVMILTMLKIHKHSGLNCIRAESQPDISEHLCKLFAGTLLTLVNTFASCLRIPHINEHLCILAPACSLLY